MYSLCYDKLLFARLVDLSNSSALYAFYMVDAISGLCGWNWDDVQERTLASLSASPSNNEARRPPDLLFSNAYHPSITPIDTSHSSP